MFATAVHICRIVSSFVSCLELELNLSLFFKLHHDGMFCTSSFLARRGELNPIRDEFTATQITICKEDKMTKLCQMRSLSSQGYFTQRMKLLYSLTTVEQIREMRRIETKASQNKQSDIP